MKITILVKLGSIKLLEFKILSCNLVCVSSFNSNWVFKYWNWGPSTFKLNSLAANFKNMSNFTHFFFFINHCYFYLFLLDPQVFSLNNKIKVEYQVHKINTKAIFDGQYKCNPTLRSNSEDDISGCEKKQWTRMCIEFKRRK